MTRRKNIKRIDPRYFLNETVNRNDDGSRLEEDLDETQLSEEEIEEGFKDFVQGAKDTFRDITKGRKLGKTRQIRKDKEAALDYEAGRAEREKEYERDRREREAEDARSGDAISNVFGGSKAKARIARQDAEERSEKRKRAEIERRRQKVKDDIQADKFKNRSRLRNQELGEID